MRRPLGNGIGGRQGSCDWGDGPGEETWDSQTYPIPVTSSLETSKIARGAPDHKCPGNLQWPRIEPENPILQVNSAYLEILRTQARPGGALALVALTPLILTWDPGQRLFACVIPSCPDNCLLVASRARRIVRSCRSLGNSYFLLYLELAPLGLRLLRTPSEDK